jgi:cell division protein FtsW
LLAAAVALAVLGAAMNLGLSGSASVAVQSQDRMFFFKREIVRLAVAGALLLVSLKINYRRLRRLALPGLILALGLLAAALAIGANRGARSWIFGLQPAEPARLALVIYLAHYIDRRREKMGTLISGFILPLLPMAAVSGLIVLQPDFGSALAIAIIGYAMLFLGGANLIYLGGGLAATAAGLAAAAVAKPHVIGRLQGYWLTLTQPDMLQELSSSAAGHLKNTLVHTHQALLAVGSGGLFGVGLGQSRQKLMFISEPHTDFIYSIIAEEGGFLVAAGVLLVFLFILWRGFRIAGQLPDSFDRNATLGLTLSIFVYSTINIMVNLGLFPITGLPLPFLSYGGTALAVNAASVGLILNISRHRGERSIESFTRKRYESNHSRWRDGRSSLSRAGGGRRPG